MYTPGAPAQEQRTAEERVRSLGGACWRRTLLASGARGGSVHIGGGGRVVGGLNTAGASHVNGALRDDRKVRVARRAFAWN